jgi:hypothetical protein
MKMVGHKNMHAVMAISDTISSYKAFAVLALLLACQTNIVAADEHLGTSTVGSSDDAGSGISTRPDLGSDAIVCGMPDEIAGLDDEIEMLVGCEIYRGGVSVPHPTKIGLAPLASLRIIEGDFSSNSGSSVSLEGANQLQWVGSFVFSQGDIGDLSPMSHLAGVDDAFGFFSTTGLTDADGLQELRMVGGGFTLRSNDDLESVDGFSGLEWIGGDMRILLNPKLRSLSGLSRLRQVDGDVTIRSNDLLPQAEIDALLSRIQVDGEIILE